MRLTSISLSILLLLGGCTVGEDESDGGTGLRDAGNPLEGCDENVDSDGDGIADDAEGTGDTDADGIPNHMDTDADGDGIDDSVEHMGNPRCSLPDSDSDGIPNWLDLDSDNDGLPDAEEAGTYSTDPYNTDTDGDGVTDLGEALGTRTDPNDPSSTIAGGDFFVVLPYNGTPENRQLRFDTNLIRADVYFLIDTTGSMQDAIDNVSSSLSNIATQIRMRIPNVELGVGQYRDFPNAVGLGGFNDYGSAGDMPYAHEQDITADIPSVQAALSRLSAGGGADTPESASEALYQVATGEGETWTFMSGASPFVLPRKACPAVPDEVGRRVGYPCFRPDSLPIVVLVTDAPFHNGPGGSNSYTGITPMPHFFDQSVAVLNQIGARFIGVAVGTGGRDDERAAATMTGTVDLMGNPLVYDASGGTVSNAIVEGIETLAGRTPQDVDAISENVAGNPDNFDATMFISAITPVEGYNGGQSGPIPGVTYRDKDDQYFYDLVPGTTAEFDVRFVNSVRPPAATAQIFRATIIVRGNSVARLDSRNVYIVVPPDGAIIII